MTLTLTLSRRCLCYNRHFGTASWTDELVEDYGLRVRELATRAFSDVPSDIFEMLAREAFFKGCFNPEAARIAMMKEPETLTDAIQFMRKAAYNEQLVGHHKARVRKVTIQTDQDMVSAVPPSELTSLSWSIERMNDNIEKLCSKFGVAQEGRTAETSVRDSSPSASPGRFSRSPSRDSSGRNTDNCCFNCGEEGHFSRDCIKERRLRSPSPFYGNTYDSLKRVRAGLDGRPSARLRRKGQLQQMDDERMLLRRHFAM